MRSDFFNEVLITAMLAASYGTDNTPASSDGDTMAQAGVLETRLTTLMDEAGKKATLAGMPQELVEAADFAICAFVDEILLSSPAWQGHAEWMMRPLQFVRHETATAGEDFYSLLDSLLNDAQQRLPSLPTDAPLCAGNTSQSNEWESSGIDQGLHHTEETPAQKSLRACLELFALCLAQGFTGMYYAEPAKISAKLRAIGAYVPSVATQDEFFSLAPPQQSHELPSRPKASNLVMRFDLLDVLLWAVPPALTLILYTLCSHRLDQIILPILHGGPQP